jgi:hypothetical protein
MRLVAGHMIAGLSAWLSVAYRVGEQCCWASDKEPSNPNPTVRYLPHLCELPALSSGEYGARRPASVPCFMHPLRMCLQKTQVAAGWQHHLGRMVVHGMAVCTYSRALHPFHA